MFNYRVTLREVFLKYDDGPSKPKNDDIMILTQSQLLLLLIFINLSSILHLLFLALLPTHLPPPRTIFPPNPTLGPLLSPRLKNVDVDNKKSNDIICYSQGVITSVKTLGANISINKA